MKRYQFFLGLIIFLSACHISKDIEAPISDIPSSYRNGKAGDTQTIATLPWRDLFREPELQALIDSALANNLDMQLAIRNIDIARHSLRQARMSLLPAAGLNIGVSSTIPSKNSLNGSLTEQFLGTSHIEDYTANLGLSWEADIWGKVRSRKRAALASYLQTEEVKRAIQTNIVSMVSQAYYHLLMLDEQLKVAQKNAALSDSTVRILSLQQQAGQVTALATQQANAQRLLALQLVPQLEQEVELQENALSVLLGAYPHGIKRSGTLYSFSIPSTVYAGIPVQLVRSRPDVKGSEFALARANANVGLAKADFFPSLVVSASTGINSFKASNWFAIPSSLFGIGAGSIAQPLLQRGQIRARYNISLAERDQAVIRFRQSVLQAVEEVSGAIVRLEKLEGQYRIVKERAGVLQQATRNAQLLYQNGMATYLEVITAQSNSLQSELTLANIKLEQMNAFTELYRSLGGGWQ
ncbi:MAG: efflux transporter outer membrane subunit [Sphingobacteriales bacterium]|nr:MAG: efflux transporter outer membrane subunit [Sphingobacteriales bacterium]